ncbi:MAG: LamG domain-containing protein [Labilithrix sp.]|nr:LamG domain-containing protein [Labilithrix sp.]
MELRPSLVALSVGLAACGFDGIGTGSPATSVDPTSPAPDPAPAAPPPPGPGASTPVAPCSDPALAFDGLGDEASVADDTALDLEGDFTVEAWIRPGNKTLSGAEMDVVSHHDAFAGRGWVLLVRDQRVEIVVYGEEGFSAQGYSAGNAGPAYVVPGKWAHVAGTLQGDTLRVYYDGVLRDTQELGFFFGRRAYAGRLRFGRSAAAIDARFEGELDDVRLSRLARYATPTAPRPTTALSVDQATVAAWRFDEPGGVDLLDATATHRGELAAAAPSRVAVTCIPDR